MINPQKFQTHEILNIKHAKNYKTTVFVQFFKVNSSCNARILLLMEKDWIFKVVQRDSPFSCCQAHCPVIAAYAVQIVVHNRHAGRGPLKENCHRTSLEVVQM